EHCHDLAHQLVCGVEHTERDQPTRNHRRDDDDGVKAKHSIDQPDQGVEKDERHESWPHLLSRRWQELVPAGTALSKRVLDTVARAPANNASQKQARLIW